jgi:subtilisin family serine protease
MKWNSLPVLIGLLLLNTACGNRKTERNSAPTTNDQAGIIASCTDKSTAQKIAKETGTQFRVINEKQKLMEFIGLSEQELKQRLPRAKFKANKIYEVKLIESSAHFQAQNIGNEEFYGAHIPQYRNANSGRYFPHLNQINALNSNQFLGEGMTIAVIDTGVYYNHPHLSPNIKLNQADMHGANGNSIDDDGNGYINDYAGWDFYNGDAFPIDDNGHGTHVAGLAASTYMGVAPKANILPVKVLSADGRGDLGTITAGILYAVEMKADIVNLSLGGPGATVISQEIQELINSVKVAKMNNVLVVSAAGNGGNDGVGDCNDSNPIYPANIQEDNMLTVASVDSNNELTSYSNYGGFTVHVAAPGGDLITGNLYSTALPFCNGPCDQSNTPYVGMSGTSMATPVTAGLAAVVKGAYQLNSAKQIKDIIMNSGVKEDSLVGNISSGSVVNVQGALSNI